MPIPLNERVRDYENTLAGRLIRATENPDSMGFINGRWYSPYYDPRYVPGAYDPNGFGFGIDRNKNEYLKNGEFKLHHDNLGREYMTVEEERNLRNHSIANTEKSYANRLAFARSVIGSSNTPSEIKKAITISGMYNIGPGEIAKTVFEDRDAMNAFLNGSDSEYNEHMNKQFRAHGVSRRVTNTNKFLDSYLRSKPAREKATRQLMLVTPQTSSRTTGKNIQEFTQNLAKRYNLHDKGGSLNNSYKQWDDLSIKEKNDVIKVAIKNGLTTIPEIKAKYNELNSFDNGGSINKDWEDWKTAIKLTKGIDVDKDNTYDYRSFYEDSPEQAWQIITQAKEAHFTDRYKTVYHPTFSTDSIYSGKYHPIHNPNKLVGGEWRGKEFIMSPDGYRGPVSMDDRLDYLEMAEPNGVVLRESNGRLPRYSNIFNNTMFGGVLPEATVTPNSKNMYPNGGYKPSSSIKKRISNWEGKAMTEYTYDPNLGRIVAPNASFDTVARDFVNVIPRSIRSQVLGNQNLADYLYSYAYNVGPGNFKKRVVPALMNYYSGKGSAEDVAESMWATGDRKKNLSGLRKRRAVERNGVRMALGLKPKQYTNADFGLNSNTRIPMVIPSQERVATILSEFTPSNPQAFFNPELLNSRQIEVKLDNPLVDSAQAYAEELQRQDVLEKRQNVNNILGMLLGGSGLGVSPFTALANSDSPLVSLASMMQGSSNESSNPFDYTANLFAGGGNTYPTDPPNTDRRFYYDYELPENGGDGGTLGYVPRDAKFDPNKGVWFKETGPNEVTTWSAYEGWLPEATVVGHRKGILPELVTPVDNTKITAPLRPNEVKNPELANLTREGNRQHAQWAKEHPYLDIAGGVAPILPAAVVSAPYIASSLSTLPTLGTAIKSAASNPYTWRRLGTSLIGGLAVDKASKLATGKSWGENVARGVDYLTGWDLQNSDLGRTIMDFTNPGYFAGGVGFINRGLDNIERRAFEAAMRTSSRPDGLQSTLAGVKNLLHSSDGRRRLGRIGNYILTGKRGKVFGDYNSFSASDPYTGFFEYEGAPNLTGRKDFIDAFLYGDTIDPAFGVKKIAEGENFGIHAPYIAEHYAGKASKIPVYEVDTPGGLHNPDVLPLRTVDREASFATPSKYAVDAQGHISQIGIDQSNPLLDPVTMGQDIWKFNSDYFNRYFKHQNPNPFKSAVIKTGLKELDRLSTPIVTRTKWVPVGPGYTPEDISNHIEFLNASLEPKVLTGTFKLKNKKPSLPITDYKTLQGGIILQ